MHIETMKVLVVEPEKEPYVKEISSGLSSLQKEVGGFIEAVYPFEDPVAIICNEEGKLEGLPLNRALRDEGTSYHYLPPSRTVTPSAQAVEALAKTLEERGLTYAMCKTWTTDGFYRETAELVKYRRSEGYSVVEMECAALFACAKFRGAHIAQLLYTADTLANVESYDTRDWGRASVSLALSI